MWASYNGRGRRDETTLEIVKLTFRQFFHHVVLFTFQIWNPIKIQFVFATAEVVSLRPYVPCTMFPEKCAYILTFRMARHTGKAQTFISTFLSHAH